MKCFSKCLGFIVCALFALNVHAQSPDSDNQLHGDLSLQYLLHRAAGSSAHPPVIILLHGMGSNEQDLYSLRNFFPSRYAVVSARAPYVLGDGSYEWFRDASVPNQLDGDPQQLAASRARITRFIDELVQEYGFDPHQVYLIGFSQGAILSYQVALTAPQKVAGIGIMSGAIFQSFVPSIKPSPALAHIRVFISHGLADERIPVAYASKANQILRGLGMQPEFHLYPGMHHEINRDALRDLVHWLQ